MGKLLAIVSLGRGLYGRWLFHRLVAGILVAAALTIVISIMIGVMIVGGLYASYCSLLYFGAEPAGAMVLTGTFALLITALLVLLVFESLARLRRMPASVLKRAPALAGVTDLWEAFADGLMGEDAPAA